MAVISINSHLILGPIIFPTNISALALNSPGFLPLNRTMLNDNWLNLISLAIYLLEISHRTALYPLTGLNYSREKETENGEEETTDAFGLNLGAGMHFAYGKVLPFAEYKYIFSDLSQHVFRIGILIIVKEKDRPEKADH